jgi:hypothetical protein
MSGTTGSEEQSADGVERIGVRYRMRGGTKSENRRSLSPISSQLNHVKGLLSFFFVFVLFPGT